MRRLAILPALAMLAILTATATAQSSDLDCGDLTYEGAQLILSQNSSDPNRLDADGDGIACEGSASDGGAVVGTSDDTASALPDTGAGPAGSSLAPLIAIAALMLAGTAMGPSDGPCCRPGVRHTAIRAGAKDSSVVSKWRRALMLPSHQSCREIAHVFGRSDDELLAAAEHRPDDRIAPGETLRREIARADGSIRFQARWYERQLDDSGRMRATSFPTRDKARAFLVGNDRRAASPDTQTVDQFVLAYIDRCRDRLTGRTVKTYRERHASMIAPQLGARLARDLEPLDIQLWIDQLARETIAVKSETRRRFAPASIPPAVAVIQGAFREAHVRGILPRNVTTGVRRPAIGKRSVIVWTQDQ